MHSVTIRVCAGEFSATMTAIREWFDANRYQPTRYKYDHDEDAVLVTVDFSAGWRPGHLRHGLTVSIGFLCNRHYPTVGASCGPKRPVTVDKTLADARRPRHHVTSRPHLVLRHSARDFVAVAGGGDRADRAPRPS